MCTRFWRPRVAGALLLPILCCGCHGEDPGAGSLVHWWLEGAVGVAFDHAPTAHVPANCALQKLILEPCDSEGMLPVPVSAVLDASCDDGACTVAHDGREVPPGVVRMVGLREGPATLRLTLRLTNGRSISGVQRVAFWNPNALGVACDGGGQCLGPRAVVVGSRFGWICQPARIADQAEPLCLGSPVTVRIDGDAVAADARDYPHATTGQAYFCPFVSGAETKGPSADATASHVTLKAVHAGTATIHLAAGAVSRDLVVRVVDTTTLVGGEGRLQASCAGADRDRLAGCYGDGVDPIAARPAPPLVHASAPGNELVWVWRLADDTEALDTALSMTYDGPGQLLQRGRLVDADAKDPSIFFLDLAQGQPGVVRVTATHGAATATWSVRLEP